MPSMLCAKELLCEQVAPIQPNAHGRGLWDRQRANAIPWSFLRQGGRFCAKAELTNRTPFLQHPAVSIIGRQRAMKPDFFALKCRARRRLLSWRIGDTPALNQIVEPWAIMPHELDHASTMAERS